MNNLGKQHETNKQTHKKEKEQNRFTDHVNCVPWYKVWKEAALTNDATTKTSKPPSIPVSYTKIKLCPFSLFSLTL